MKEIRNSVLAGLVFGLIFSFFLVLMVGIQLALVLGLLSGLAFGIIIYFFITSKTVKRQTQIELKDGKEVIHSGGANHVMKGEAVGGKLYLLNDSLQFQSHGFNFQNHGLTIPIHEITQVKFYNTLGLVPNGLVIGLLNGKTEKFVVNGRKLWLEKVEGLRSGLS